MVRVSTKERIVEEAFTLFSERGFHAVSVRDIAAAVGIKDASIYNHFPSKQAIFDAIVFQAVERLKNFFVPRGILFEVGDDVSPYAGPLDAVAAQVLASFEPFFVDAYLVRLRRFLVLSQFESEQAAAAYQLIFMERPMALQRSVFEHFMATGKFALGDATQMALEFHGPAFLLLHTGMDWVQAKPRLQEHFMNFTLARQVSS